MSQVTDLTLKDFQISSQDANTGATVRAAMNDLFAALVSSNSGATEPPNPPDVGMIWFDTTTSIMKVCTTAGGSPVWTEIGNLIGSVFESGTKMWFYQNVAPTGWTLVTATTDILLGIKGGSGDYDVNGGNIAGTWTQLNHRHSGPSHTHTISSHYHSIPGHALVATELPASFGSHNHSVAHYGVGWPGTDYSPEGIGAIRIGLYGGGTTDPAGYQSTSSSSISIPGGGQTHTHGNTGAATGTTDAGGTGYTGYQDNAQANWRPRAAIGIICEKD